MEEHRSLQVMATACLLAVCAVPLHAATVQVIPQMPDVSAFSYPQLSGNCGETYATMLLVGKAWLPSRIGAWRQRDAADPYSWERDITWYQYTWAIPAARRSGDMGPVQTGNTAIHVLQSPVDPSPRNTVENPFLTYNSLVDGTSRIDFFEQQRNGGKLDQNLMMNSSANKPGQPAYNGPPQLAGNLAAMVNELNRQTPLQYQLYGVESWQHQRDVPVQCNEELSSTEPEQNEALNELAALAADRLNELGGGSNPDLEDLARMAGERLGDADDEEINWSELADNMREQLDDWDEAQRRAAARLEEEQRQQELARQSQQAAERARQLALEQARREQAAQQSYEEEITEDPGALNTLFTGLLQGYMQYQTNRSGVYVPPIYGVNSGPTAGGGVNLPSGSEGNSAGCNQLATAMESSFAQLERNGGGMCAIATGGATHFAKMARQAQSLCPAYVETLNDLSRQYQQQASQVCGTAAPQSVNTWNPGTATPAPPAPPPVPGGTPARTCPPYCIVQ